MWGIPARSNEEHVQPRGDPGGAGGDLLYAYECPSFFSFIRDDRGEHLEQELIRPCAWDSNVWDGTR